MLIEGGRSWHPFINLLKSKEAKMNFFMLSLALYSNTRRHQQLRNNSYTYIIENLTVDDLQWIWHLMIATPTWWQVFKMFVFFRLHFANRWPTQWPINQLIRLFSFSLNNAGLWEAQSLEPRALEYPMGLLWNFAWGFNWTPQSWRMCKCISMEGVRGTIQNLFIWGHYDKKIRDYNQ